MVASSSCSEVGVASMAEEHSNSSSCFSFTRRQFETITLTKDVILGVSLGVCCLAIVFIALIKAYRLFVHRLALYLNVATLFESLAFILVSVAVTYNDQLGRVEVKNSNQLENLCKATGFLLQYFSWVVILLVCLITFYLFLLVNGKLLKGAQKHTYETVGVLVSLLLPLTFTWTPFIRDLYGLAGPWCWIKSGHENCTRNFTEGAAYQFGIWYAPATFLLGVNSLIILVIVVILCKRAWHTRKEDYELLGDQSTHKKALNEALPLLFYTLVYIIFFSFPFANRIVQNFFREGKQLMFSLWVVHTVARSVLYLIVPLGFILHPYTLRNLRQLCSKANMLWSTYSTEFIVSADDPGDGEVLVIKGTSGEINQSSYRSVFES